MLVEYLQLQRPVYLRNLARYIGVTAPAAMSSHLAKQGSPDVIGAFADQDAVMETLVGHGKEHWAREHELYFDP